jgi:hypothetical protein
MGEEFGILDRLQTPIPQRAARMSGPVLVPPIRNRSVPHKIEQNVNDTVMIWIGRGIPAARHLPHRSQTA